MAERTVVFITGANTGIGFETVKALLESEKHYRIFLGGRSLDKAESAVSTLTEQARSGSSVEAVQIDLESDESITGAFHTISGKAQRLDVLINNAGASFDAQITSGQMTSREGWNKAWNVNVSGTNVVTEVFLPLLLKSSDPKLIFNTSGASSLSGAADPNNLIPKYVVPPAGLPKPFGFTSYRASKVGLNMLMIEWKRRLTNDGVKVWAVAPGLLATGLGGDTERLKSMGAGDPSLGGQALCGVVEGKRDAHIGRVVKFYGDNPVLEW